jgi:uroporphyrinogen-III synthase/outer membrane murein-binding lipoprotein Lpp
MRVLVFRPQPDADRSASALRERGKQPVVAPLFSVVPGEEEPPAGPFDALILTSGNAVPALARAPQDWRGRLPAYCVGTRTTELAGEAGFTAHAAEGNRAALLALLRERLPPKQKLLLAAGRDRHEDLPEQLRADGHEVTIWTAYESRAVAALPEAAAEALRQGSADAALHYSPRGARTFLELTREAGLTEQALALPQVALSAEIAAPLIAAGAATVLVAEQAEEAALFAALDQLSAKAGTSPETGQSEEPRAGKRRSRSGRTPPTIELAAEPPQPEIGQTAEPGAAETEANTEAVLPTEALPEEFSPPPVADHPRRPGLPALALAGLVGGVVGAGLVLLGLRLAGPAEDTRIAELASRVETLQARTAALPDRAALEALDRKAGAAGDSAAKAMAEAQANAGRLAELAKAAQSPAGLAERIAGIESSANAAREAAAAVGRRLDETGQRIAGVEAVAKSAALPSEQAQAATRVVLVQRLRSALDEGRPFRDGVAALAKGGLPAEQLAALDAAAAKGAATRDQLLAQFGRHRALFLRETAPAANSWQDKLLGLASRIVSVRPVGEAGSTDPATLPIRLEAALTQGDIVRAAQLWTQLPEPARRGSEAFGTALQQRAAAETALDRIAQDAVAALGKAD